MPPASFIIQSPLWLALSLITTNGVGAADRLKTVLMMTDWSREQHFFAKQKKEQRHNSVGFQEKACTRFFRFLRGPGFVHHVPGENTGHRKQDLGNPVGRIARRTWEESHLD